jgi:hypothetical protein
MHPCLGTLMKQSNRYIFYKFIQFFWLKYWIMSISGALLLRVPRRADPTPVPPCNLPPPRCPPPIARSGRTLIRRARRQKGLRAHPARPPRRPINLGRRPQTAALRRRDDVDPASWLSRANTRHGGPHPGLLASGWPGEQPRPLVSIFVY